MPPGLIVLDDVQYAEAESPKRETEIKACDAFNLFQQEQQNRV